MPWAKYWLIGALVLLVIVSGAGVATLWANHASSVSSDQAKRRVDLALGARVRTTIVTRSSAIRHLALLGESRPFASVTLYAKVSGYLQRLDVDVGDRVTAGQPLATIESPETDRSYLAAKADFDNKEVTAKRVGQLLDRKLVSPQEADQARTEAAIAHERLESFREQQAYETLRAPFSGVVTARFADPGALLQNAANSQTSALPVVTVSQNDRLRIFTYLDQTDAAYVHVGTPALVTLTERPGLRVPVRVTRLSGQLDTRTRKMLVEIEVDDRDGRIVPGSFVQVELDLVATPQAEAPAEALVVRNGKSLVALIGDDGRVHFHPVAVSGNDGRMVTFASGVQPGERLALSLGSSVADGAKVQAEAAAPPRAVPTAAADSR